MHNPDVAHEHSDVDIRTILRVRRRPGRRWWPSAFVLMWVHVPRPRRQAADQRPAAVAAGACRPAQRAAGAAPADQRPEGLAKFRMTEAKTLEGYGWVDQQAGVAHVPIAEAKKLILQRGLPVRAGGAVDDPRVGTHAPAMGESSGGRTIGAPAPREDGTQGACSARRRAEPRRRRRARASGGRGHQRAVPKADTADQATDKDRDVETRSGRSG